MRVLRLVQGVIMAAGLAIALVGCDEGGSAPATQPNTVSLQELSTQLRVGALWVFQQSVDGTPSDDETWEMTGTQSVDGQSCLVIKRTEGSALPTYQYFAYTESRGLEWIGIGYDEEGPLLTFSPPMLMCPASIPPNTYRGTTVEEQPGQQMTVQYSCQVLSTSETVTVPLGSFSNATHVKITVRQSTSNELLFESDWWITPEQGIVKRIETSGAGPAQVFELKSFTAGP